MALPSLTAHVGFLCLADMPSPASQATTCMRRNGLCVADKQRGLHAHLLNFKQKSTTIDQSKSTVTPLLLSIPLDFLDEGSSKCDMA
eukprot:20549-Amphidinium_carterae.1